MNTNLRQMTIDDIEVSPHFDGATYDPKFDHARLKGQIERIFNLMRDGKWRTLREIAAATGDPEASISAQLRNLKKPEFGSHTLNRRTRGDRERGLYDYQIIVNGGGQ